MSTVRCAPSRPGAIALAVLICCAAAGTAGAQPARPAAGAASPVAPEPLVVGITLNGEAKGDFFVFRTAAGDMLVKVEDLKTIGVQTAGTVTQVDGEPHVSLSSIQGISFVIDPVKATLAITADASLLPRRVLDLSTAPRATGLVPRDNSAFLNYGLRYSDGSSYAKPKYELAAESGMRWGDYLLLADGATVDRADGSRKFVRLMSSLTRDDRQSLRRWAAGDFFTPSRDFGIGANMGGLSLSKLYDINPYLVQHPTQSIRGSVTLPSDLEVYLDGQRIRTERLSPGEFELRDLATYGGARSVQLVLRDAFGRVQNLAYSFYVSEQPLRQGLHEYSYSVGALRQDFGTKSNQYGPAAYSMFHRVGLTDAVTLGLRAEGTRDLVNAGPSATVVLGPFGVVNAALAQSSIRGRRGSAASLGYNYHSREWGFGFVGRRDWGDFAVLGTPIQVTNRNFEFSANASVNLGPHGSLGLSHSKLDVDAGRASSPVSATQPFSVVALPRQRVTALTYNVPLISGKVALTATLRHIKDQTTRNEAFVGLIFFPDRDYVVTGNVRADSQGRHSEFAQFSRNQPIGEGLGYSVSTEHLHEGGLSAVNLRSSAQYNAPAAVLHGEFNASRDGGRTIHERRLGISGGVAYVGDRIAFGRPIVDSFALVKVSDIPGVAVTANGQQIGKTNAQGEVFVPTLRAYYDNEISIRPADVPIDRSIDTAKLKISPSLRSGALVNFNAIKMQAITGKLKYTSGQQTLPLEHQLVAISVADKRHSFRTGRGGEFYLENVPPGTYPAQATTPAGTTCRFDLTVPRSDETFLELPEMVCRTVR